MRGLRWIASHIRKHRVFPGIRQAWDGRCSSIYLTQYFSAYAKTGPDERFV